MMTLTKKEMRPVVGDQGCDWVGLSLTILRRVMPYLSVWLGRRLRLIRSIKSMLTTKNCRCTRMIPVLKIGDAMLTELRVA